MRPTNKSPFRLDRRLTLRYALASRSDTGASVDTWYDGATVWGSWLPTSGREFYAAKAKHAEATGIFRIRHRTDVDPTWRLVHGDDLFEVVAVSEVGRRDFLDLIVRALDQTVGSALRVLILEGDDSSNVLLLEGDTETPVLLESA